MFAAIRFSHFPHYSVEEAVGRGHLSSDIILLTHAVAEWNKEVYYDHNPDEKLPSLASRLKKLGFRTTLVEVNEWKFIVVSTMEVMAVVTQSTHDEYPVYHIAFIVLPPIPVSIQMVVTRKLLEKAVEYISSIDDEEEKEMLLCGDLEILVDLESFTCRLNHVF